MTHGPVGHESLLWTIFPFHLQRGDRAFTYASFDRPEPRQERQVGEGWESIGKLDPLVFHAWCLWLDEHYPHEAAQPTRKAGNATPFVPGN